ncbi:biotin--[acetyl-CoA-carboxylase] ligase [Companilactobacillus ginsenosidimutans]|uniref:biotin--[acetyl-CoA-carboxylase] ligase n=1 Tax=Companilactobacillus ginsenosidimutans TaxID=1007676 RepID=UPI000660585C|nr:biotin--[acetyl-CoA-carboxylase] ligase [Companilactobacillus ginsenosidimutans]
MTNQPIIAEKILTQYNCKTPVSIEVFSTLNSTNTYAKENIASFSNEHPTLIIAEHQTAGYGRFKRDFYSPDNSGIYLTLVLPINEHVDPGLLTLSTGLSVVETLQQRFPTQNFTLKWINDILLDKQKCGGILAESHSNSHGEISHIILGIGLNINTSQFPSELKSIAKSASSDADIDRNKIIAELLTNFFRHYQTYQSGDFLPDYRKACSTLGKKVEIVNGNTVTTGIAQDIGGDGSLILLDDKKNRHLINSGEVRKVFTNE